MRIIYSECPNAPQEDNGKGGISFELGNYTYFITEIDYEIKFFSRQLTNDYYDDKNNWEDAEWISTKTPKFKFLKD